MKEGEICEVDYVVKKRIHACDSEHGYLVHWKGYDDSHHTALFRKRHSTGHDAADFNGYACDRTD